MAKRWLLNIKFFCRAASRIKGNHIYQSRPEMNTVFDSEIEPNNNELIHAILVYKEMHNGNTISREGHQVIWIP